MAARQDQTSTIIISTMGVFLFVLAGLSYWTGSQWSKEYTRAEDLAQQKSEADRVSRQNIGEAEQLKGLIGYEPSTPTADIVARYEEDQTQYMANFDAGTRSYRSVLDYIYAENKKISEQESAAKAAVKDLQQRLVAIQAEADEQISEARSAADQAKQDLAAERTRFREERTAIERQRDQVTQTLAKKAAEFEKTLAAARDAKDEAETQFANVERSRAQLLAERGREDRSFELADGLITYVNQANGVAWINLGEGDALRNQVTFSVFDADLNDAGKAKKKGSIEVTRLLGDHLAEAEITSDDPRDPILPGDQVYSQVWQRGKQLRFAVTGFVDIDGDGLSDLARAKNLIAINGATIDSALEDDGKISGKMSIDTRYLVLGEYPDTPSKAFYQEGYERMTSEAAALGVETITMADFLTQMGYRLPGETTTYTQRSRTGGGSPTSFRFRTP